MKDNSREKKAFQNILYEEKLRKRIVDAISPQKKESRVFRFLNSPFGLFLLSSILISGLGKLYYHYDAKAKEEYQASLEIRKVVYECEYRLAVIDIYLGQIEAQDAKAEDTSPSIFIWQVVSGNKDYTPTLPEFKGIPLIGIIIRLNNFNMNDDADRAKSAAIRLDFLKGPGWKYDVKQAREELAELYRFTSSVNRELIK